jgi:hypothetical protein
MTFRGEGMEAEMTVVALGGVRRDKTESECCKRKQTSWCEKGYLAVEVGKVDGFSFLAPCPVWSLAYDHWQ